MNAISQIVEGNARPHFHIMGVGRILRLSQTVEMENSKNGGPNFLQAWRESCGMTQEALAEKLETTASVISYLEQGERGLSAKWLRKIAPILGTTPGRLLDHHPDDIRGELIAMFDHAEPAQRQQIIEIAQTIVRARST